MRNWKGLGFVDTIYEEEDCEYSSSSPSLSPSLSSPPTPLHSRVESWTLATGRKTDVLIYVGGTCFHLHKDPLASRSDYLKRQLTELSEITLPFNITAETFAVVADFCYGAHIVVTPFNVAALRTAAELLEMGRTNGRRDENLKQVTETYFDRVIVVNRELALIVFRSCLRLLPESETTTFLVSRCFETLHLMDDGDELDSCLDEIVTLGAVEFQIFVESVRCRFTSQDLLYRIIDLYIKEQNGKITEDQKMEICNIIDCDKLSPQVLIHAVQNPRLPLRFILQAMLIEQLNTRRAVFTTSNHRTGEHQAREPITLGSILLRDAAVREAAQLKAEMGATYSRIESLEKQLAGMRKLLQKSENERSIMEKKLLLEYEKARGVVETSSEKVLHELKRDERSIMESSRCASFHHGLRDAKIERGERGSTSFSNFQLGLRGERTQGSSSLSKPISKKGLISRLRSTLWISKSNSKQIFKQKE